MIIITDERDDIYYTLAPGDMFNLSFTQHGESEGEEFKWSTNLISEEFKKEVTIDYVCVFRFANEDGSLVGWQVSGFFGQKHLLPPELVGAKRMKDLTPEQAANLKASLEDRAKA